MRQIGSTPVTLSPEALGRRIIEINRAARLGSTTPAEWSERIERLMVNQPDINGPIAVRNVRALEGGAGSSSGTLFFEATHTAAGTTVDGRYVLRFRPDQALFHAYDLDGQVRIQRALAETDVPVPRQCWEDISGRFLDVPGYVMERAPGEAAPAAWFAEGLFAVASPEQRGLLINSYLSTLAKIHAVDWRRRGLGFLLERAAGEGLIERELNWYWDGLRQAQEVEALERFEPVRRWLTLNQPPVTKPVLCHGDTNFTNNLFASERVTAVLDWEMAFIGVPEADLAYALYAMDALGGPPLEGIPTPEQMITRYEEISGWKVKHLDYYRLFALYRVVLILTMGKRVFPPDFQGIFSGYIESTAAKMFEQFDLLKSIPSPKP